MANEPELHPYQTGEWVTYLQQLLQHHGFWPGPEDGEFGDQLVAAVRLVQEQYQLNPADGVVRADLWALLTGETSASSSATTSTTASTSTADQHGESHGLHGTGAHPAQVPASMVSGGLPAFQYNLPNVPLAEVTFDAGAAMVHMQLWLTGSVTVTFAHATPGVTTTVNDQTWQVAAQHSLNGLTEGVQVQGFGQQVSLSSTYGNQFQQTEVRYSPPNTMSFLGSGQIGYHHDTAVGYATVQGSVGFQLDVTVTPHPQAEPEPVREVADERSWFEEYAPVVLAGAVVVLVVVVAVAAAPETGGGSLFAIPEAGELGAAAAGAL